MFHEALTAHHPAEKAFFGISLVGNSNGDTLLVGATGEAEGDFEDAGGAYVFHLKEQGGFELQTRLAARARPCRAACAVRRSAR